MPLRAARIIRLVFCFHVWAAVAACTVLGIVIAFTAQRSGSTVRTIAVDRGEFEFSAWVTEKHLYLSVWHLTDDYYLGLPRPQPTAVLGKNKLFIDIEKIDLIQWGEQSNLTNATKTATFGGIAFICKTAQSKDDVSYYEVLIPVWLVVAIAELPLGAALWRHIRKSKRARLVGFPVKG
jgi:hypothetical protein